MIIFRNTNQLENALYSDVFCTAGLKTVQCSDCRFGEFLIVSYIAKQVNNKAHVSTELRALQADIQGGDCSAQQPKRALPSKPGSAGLLFLLAMQFSQPLVSRSVPPMFCCAMLVITVCVYDKCSYATTPL